MILREDMIEQSVQDLIRAELPTFDYTPDLVNLRDAFPTLEERSKPLDKTQLAAGFSFDDGGKPAEIGSNLTRFQHTIEFWVFATGPRIGKNLANVVKHIAWRSVNLPLYDYNQDGNPQIDAMPVLRAQVARQINSSPRPWDMWVWTVKLAIEDISYP